LPGTLSSTPKRALQTPQREWLRGPLHNWASERINIALSGPAANWFDRGSVLDAWDKYGRGEGDNSFFVWQWISASYIENGLD